LYCRGHPTKETKRNMKLFLLITIACFYIASILCELTTDNDNVHVDDHDHDHDVHDEIPSKTTTPPSSPPLRPSSSSSLTPGQVSALFNDRLDEVIRDTLAKHESDISPYRVADQVVTFHQEIGSRNMTGVVGFTDVHIDGLTSIRRINHAHLERLGPGEDVLLTIHLETGRLEVKSITRAKFLGIGPRINSKLTLAHANGKAVLRYKHRTEEVIVDRSFHVGDITGLKFKIKKAPGFVTPAVATQIANGALTIFNPIIKSAVTKAGNTILDHMVKDSAFVKDLMNEANSSRT